MLSPSASRSVRLNSRQSPNTFDAASMSRTTSATYESSSPNILLPLILFDDAAIAQFHDDVVWKTVVAECRLVVLTQDWRRLPDRATFEGIEADRIGELTQRPKHRMLHRFF